MGSVVDLSARPGKDRARRGKKRSRTALVLGGGGLTGGVYEIGALRALDLLSVNRSVNDFDIYVGTSAGSFVAALTANGVTTEEMMRVVNRQRPAPFADIDLGQLLRLNAAGAVRSAVALPWRAAKLARRLAPDLRHISLMDLALGLAEGFPDGLYSGAGIEGYLAKVLAEPGRTDDFRELGCELYLTATDLDSCERVVFGAGAWDDVPISTAVRASTALPMVYEPVRLRDRELVDGGLISTTNLDIAVDAGAKLIVVVNPLVPYIDATPPAEGAPRRHISEMGMPFIGYQSFKMMAHQRLHEMAKHWGERYPGVDIVLIEPEPHDELMFRTSIMNFASRMDVARHGFRSVTVKLGEDYEHLRGVAARHGIEISADQVREVLERFAGEPERARWRQIFEQTTASLLRQPRAS